MNIKNAIKRVKLLFSVEIKFEICIFVDIIEIVKK